MHTVVSRAALKRRQKKPLGSHLGVCFLDLVGLLARDG